jgi:hypothetical protein
MFLRRDIQLDALNAPMDEGDVVAVPVRCQATGPVGRVIDRVAPYRVAEAGGRSFLHRVGDELLIANTP